MELFSKLGLIYDYSLLDSMYNIMNYGAFFKLSLKTYINIRRNTKNLNCLTPEIQNIGLKRNFFSCQQNVSLFKLPLPSEINLSQQIGRKA